MDTIHSWTPYIYCIQPNKHVKNCLIKQNKLSSTYNLNNSSSNKPKPLKAPVISLWDLDDLTAGLRRFTIFQQNLWNAELFYWSPENGRKLGFLGKIRKMTKKILSFLQSGKKQQNLTFVKQKTCVSNLMQSAAMWIFFPHNCHKN